MEYIHKYMISLYENDFFSKGKMQIHAGAMLNNSFLSWIKISKFLNFKETQVKKILERL